MHFVCKHVKNCNQRGALRLQKHVKNSDQQGALRLQACQEFQSTRCTSSPSMRINKVHFVSKHVKNEFQSMRCTSSSSIQECQSTRCTSSPSMSRIPINEVYFVSKHVKNSNQRGALRLQACQEFQGFQSTRVYFVSKHVKLSLIHI